jgi:RNA polymerase sigma factor (sigma-70 family)
VDCNVAAAPTPAAYGSTEPVVAPRVRLPKSVGAARSLPTDASFASVLARARAGANQAWTDIYRAFSPAVLGYLRGLGAAEAEDLTGEVFLQVVRDLHRFDGDRAAFKAWVLTIAHHRFLDDRRRSRRRPVELVPDPPERDGLAATSATDALLGAGRVQELLAGLSPDQRAVLLLRVVGDLTVQETSRVIGKRAGAVKALQRRGLAALSRRLREEDGR